MIEDYRERLHDRYPTMNLALELYESRGGHTIVETGCIRQDDDWGAGMSTLIFGRHVSLRDGRLWTVDISKVSLETCKRITSTYANWIEYVQGDSVDFLSKFAEGIDLLYLDSFDYPYGELLRYYGGLVDINVAITTLRKLGDEEIIRFHGQLIAPSQEHCKHEVLAALHVLHPKSIILMDDASLPGGGKPRLARLVLSTCGWKCLLEGKQQTLWVKE